ncbi:MAG: DUF1778 domain-containing protein [Terriglobales bacterium]
MVTALKKQTAKSQRINFRASAEEERLIRLGAEKRGEKVTRFVVESACTAAELALANEKRFELPPAQFARFAEALDRPAKVISALQKLFSEKSVIERTTHKPAFVTSRTTDR